MKQRVITAIVILLAAIPVCIFSGTVLFPIVMAFIGVVGVYEMLNCMKVADNNRISAPLYGLALLAPFAVR